jgi:hypothetical protein
MLTAINISIQLNWASRCKKRTCGLIVYFPRIQKVSETAGFTAKPWKA